MVSGDDSNEGVGGVGSGIDSDAGAGVGIDWGAGAGSGVISGVSAGSEVGAEIGSETIGVESGVGVLPLIEEPTGVLAPVGEPHSPGTLVSTLASILIQYG